MLIRIQTTNLLQIFCELSLYSQVIFKSMKVADDISRGTLECEWVNNISGLEIKGCQEPRAPLNAPASPSNFCREPKYVLYDIQKTFMKLMNN